MWKLLYKEFKLGWHPSVFFFLLCGALLLIPSWVYFVACGYIFIGVMNTFFTGRANQDIFFSVSLPIRKRDVVLARTCSIAVIELLMTASAVPFAILSNVINPRGNAVFMNPNFAFFGFVLLMYAIFNAIFIPMFFKTAYKIGAPVFLAVLAVIVYATGVEVAVHAVPILAVHVNAFGATHLMVQLPVLLVGIGLFALMTILAYQRAAKNFEKIDV